MRAKRCLWTGGCLGLGVLLLVVLALVRPAASTGQIIDLGLKANLDLQFNAGAASDDDEEDAPEIVLFYGAQ